MIIIFVFFFSASYPKQKMVYKNDHLLHPYSHDSGIAQSSSYTLFSAYVVDPSHSGLQRHFQATGLPQGPGHGNGFSGTAIGFGHVGRRHSQGRGVFGQCLAVSAGQGYQVLGAAGAQSHGRVAQSYGRVAQSHGDGQQRNGTGFHGPQGSARPNGAAQSTASRQDTGHGTHEAWHGEGPAHSRSGTVYDVDGLSYEPHDFGRTLARKTKNGKLD